MRTLIQDLSYAARTFARTPGFTAVVVISIALGIAANTTVFSIVNGLLLSSAPVGDPGRLYTFNDGNSFSWPNFVDYRDETTGKVFEGVAGFFPLVAANVGGRGEPERVWGQLVTSNYFDVAHVKPALGRTFLPEEDAVEGRNPVVVLGHALWQRRFGSDAGIIGRTIALNGMTYTVIGVAPPAFTGTIKMITGEFWAPVAMYRHLMPDLAKDNIKTSRSSQWIMVDARLKKGTSMEQASAALNVVKNRIDETYFKGDKDRRKQTIRLTSAGRLPQVGNAIGLMAVLMVVVGLVLLIACANVANLMLARAATRRKEIGVRLSIGAARGRLIRQLLTESVFLAVMGAALGFVLAEFATLALSRFQLPMSFPISFDFTPDWRVLAFTIALSVLTGVVFGLAPAIRSARTDLVSCLKDQGSGLGGVRRFGLRNGLVVVQVSLSLVLLVGSGLFVRSLQNASSIDLGMNTDNVIMLAFDPKLNNYTPERSNQFLSQLRARVSAMPGVKSVSFVDSIPLSIGGVSFDFEASGARSGKRVAEADVYRVGRNYFQTLGLPIVRGRDFEARDGAGVAIVNERLAQQLFPKQDAIGQTITEGKNVYQVIAIANNSKSRTLGEAPANCAYLSLEAAPHKVMSFFGISIVAKTATNAGQYARAIRGQIQTMDPNMAVTGTETMQEHVNKALLLPKVCATLLGVFGLVGLALATIGLYGVLSYVVRSRTREIGIRMALGANRNGVIGMIARQGLALAGIGTIIGLALAWAVTRFATTFLYGIGAHDPVTFIGVPVVLLGIALVAILGPARRASRVEPMSALRYE
jgi:predicted permease